jgi:hypothetical protein
MNRRWTRRLILVVGLTVVSLPVAGWWARRSANVGCALDGGPINPVYRVQVVDQHGLAREFCCLHCAGIWLQRQSSPPRRVTVTDETTGQGLDAAAAWYVRSLVITTPTTGNRIHVFRNRQDANQHAASFGGTLVSKPVEAIPLPGATRLGRLAPER